MSEIERKLASVRRIAEIRPIEGADNIVCAVVDGWELVTQKSNNFTVGDLVVYFEIDSLLPICPEFEFLRDKCYVSAARSVNGEGFRLKTIKLRGQVSQGLILPLKDIYMKMLGYNDYYFEDYDLTEALGVKKFEKPLPSNLAGVARGNFPTFIPKTDQERVQNIFNKIKEKYSNHPFEATIKLDGSSMTVYNKKGPIDRFGVCSRNLDLEESADNLFWKVARKNDLERKLQECGFSFAIQGELMGPGVQGNREELTEHDFYVFDIYRISDSNPGTGRYYDSHDRRIVAERLGLKHVPFIEYVNLKRFDTVQDILAYADRASLKHPIAEGVVFKSMWDTTVSFKVINNKFLLKEKD